MSVVEPEVDDAEVSSNDLVDATATEVLRAGVRASPELRKGFVVSVTFAMVVAAGRLVVPVSIQQILDRGFTSDGPDWGFIVGACIAAYVAIMVLAVLDRVTLLRLLTTAENVLYGLRTRAFAHVHDLSLAHHSETKRGVLVARVTSDIEVLAQFASWGAISWVVNLTLIVVAIAALAVYQWQLALIVVVVLLPIVPAMRIVQKRQLRAYDNHRSRVADTLSAISETIGGVRVLRSYGAVRRARRELHESIEKQYRTQLVARFYFAIMFPLSDLFSGLALAAVVGVGVWWGPGWGMAAGTLVAAVFITNLIVQPVAEIGEVLDQTQTALAGWRKVLDLLEEPVEVAEPEHSATLPPGALRVDVEGVRFEYEPGRPVLHDIDLHIPAGANVAVVGETGSGKSTLAKLL
ncbi:MAG: ABC transporter ATP-binding protein, partial [Microthrixaceae bacterium]|nr:ABC transporter ATP-binding protein [Microthrixaceae bacterium]